MKNKKFIFFTAALLVLIIGLGAVSAESADNSTAGTDSQITGQITHEDQQVVAASDNSIGNTDTGDVKNIHSKENNVKNTDRILSDKSKSRKVSVKSDVSSVDYYISDSTGSDDNDGSHNAPYKTVGKAVNQTGADRVYNIHILNGTYKGSGNTNLTVNGNYHINFIGEGINKTVFDGEVDYDVQKNGFYWGSSEIWYYYVNGTGNWFMNITEGTGKITITNMTMQNAWVKGGSSINAYTVAPVDNYAALSVENVYFYHNLCGVGAAIRNRENGTLTVDNCTFDYNMKSDSTGNDGIIYNNGTAYLNNSLFVNNYARWGTILNDKVISINNCTFKNGTAYDGTSTFKYGSGIASNSGQADFYNSYGISGIVTNITNCTFIDNEQTDIWQAKGHLLVEGCNFINSTGIYISSGSKNMSIVQNITNNNFTNMQPSTLYTSMSSTRKPSFAVNNVASGYNLTIANNRIDVPYGTYNTGITTVGCAYIYNNTMNNVIEVNGNSTSIVNNSITSMGNVYAVKLNGLYNNVTGNYLFTSIYKGDMAVNYSSDTNLVKNNLPNTRLIVLNETVYDTYFNNSTLKDEYLDVDQIQINGTLLNRNMTFNRTVQVFQLNNKITSYNITIKSTGSTAIDINGVSVENTNSQPAIIINSSSSVSNTNLKTNNNYTIIASGVNNTISNNKLIANIVTGNDSINASANNTMINNTPSYLILKDDTYEYFFNSNGVLKDEITENTTIHVVGDINNKMLNITRQIKLIPENTTYSNSTIIIDENVKRLNIQNIKLSEKSRIIINSDKSRIDLTNITIENTNTTAVTVNGNNNNITIKTLKITDSQSDILITGKNNKINMEKINTTLNSTVNIILDNAGYNNITLKSDITAKEFNILFNNSTYNKLGGEITGKQNTTLTITIKNNSKNNKIEQLTLTGTQTEETPITIDNSDNNTIYNNKINYSNLQGHVINIINGTDNTVEYNIINSKTLHGNSTVQQDNTDNTVQYNSQTEGTAIKMTLGSRNINGEVTVKALDTMNITTTLTVTKVVFNPVLHRPIQTTMNVTKGTVTYKINNIEIGTVNVTNGTSSITYKLTGTEETPLLIEATYKDQTLEYKLTITTMLRTIIKYNTEMTLGNITNNGKNALFTAIITDENKNIIDNGTVEFRIDNSTIGTANIKNKIAILQADITDYTNGTHNITATYTGNNTYNATTGKATLTITKSSTTILINPVNDTLYDNNITVTGKLRDNNNERIINATLTYENNTVTTDEDGEFIFNIPAQEGTNSITITYTGNNIYNPTSIAVTYNGLKHETAITVNPVKDTITDNQVNITGTLKDTNSSAITDQNITITINSIEYNTTTDENGEFKINTIAKPGNNNITVNYQGNKYYNPSVINTGFNGLKHETTITINPINTVLYEDMNITATITDEKGNPVNNGQVFFKINGKTLTDNNGNNIYVDVINGTATLNYYINSMKINTTTAVYTGNTYYSTARTNQTVNIDRINATMKLEVLNDNIKPGETAIIIVRVTDKNDNPINSGKVIFKLNGKTLKDANGSTITVRVHNGVALLNYTIPAGYSAKNYTLTAVSVGNTYNRAEAGTNITLTKINTYIEPVNIQFNGNTLHVQANIISTSTQTNVAYRETKVTVKINNKTFAKEMKITNGTIDLNIDTSSIGQGNYKITIKAGENGIYNGSQLDSYAYKAPVKQALNQTSENGTLVKV